MTPRPRSPLVCGTLAVVLVALLAPATTLGATDRDGDTLTDWFETNRSRTSVTKRDSDGDGLRDDREDPDKDRLTNRTEQTAALHPRKADTDGDGVRDDLEDQDGDTLWTWSENRAGTNPRDRDTDDDGRRDDGEDPDRDGLSNGWEQRLGTHPKDADSDGDGKRDSAEDRDGDGLTAMTEIGLGTDPARADSDTDGTDDAAEAWADAPSLPGASGCPVLPGTNVWNIRVDRLPLRSDSATLVASIGLDRKVHMDFGSYAGYGIPWQVVEPSTPRHTVSFEYDDESDAGPYPIPAEPLQEGFGEGDAHILTVDPDSCTLYELFAAWQDDDGDWHAGSGAVFDLESNGLRPAGWTSADAAGLPILPGLVRYDEVAAGEIAHALRFTTNRTRRAYLYPARHYASSSTDPALPPMGLRVRLKASADLTGLSPHARTIAVAMQRYGLILADNGSPWSVSGMSDDRFDDDVLHELDRFTGRSFEAVDTQGFISGP